MLLPFHLKCIADIGYGGEEAAPAIIDGCAGLLVPNVFTADDREECHTLFHGFQFSRAHMCLLRRTTPRSQAWLLER